MKHRLLLGISGGIAAYKAPLIIRELQKRDAEVKTVITSNAKQFVTELTLRTLTGFPVYSDLFAPPPADPMEHISLTEWGEALLISPATANTIA
ncbi:MAG: flavoprotein, partial [bacterium]